jgi:hypothetical protein
MLMNRGTATTCLLFACLAASLAPFDTVRAEERKLPKVTRQFWGPTELDYKKRYMLLDEPEKCKGKEYKMEVKFTGGGTRRNDKMEDITCTVFTDGSSYQMEFSFPPELKQPNIQVGDYLILSFVFSGATKSLFSQPNVVTEVTRPKK